MILLDEELNNAMKSKKVIKNRALNARSRSRTIFVKKEIIYKYDNVGMMFVPSDVYERESLEYEIQFWDF
jgi:hypothetical protein